MKRFEIEEIIAQGNSGIVYLGIDHTTEKKVSIRRFFAHSQNQTGLSREKAEYLNSLAKKLSFLEHPALRQVVEGDSDPIDGIPYLITDWVSGDPLPRVLAGNEMEPELVTDLIRYILEISIAVSELIGEEGIWIDTKIDSIIVGDSHSGRGFTFWLCPRKFLGLDLTGKQITTIIPLVKKLYGWKSKHFKNEPNHGLSDWLKTIEANPDRSLREALDSLEELTSQSPTLAEDRIVAPLTDTSKPSSLNPRIKYAILGFTAVLLILIIALVPQFFAPADTSQSAVALASQASDSRHTFYSPDDTLTLGDMDTGTRVRIRGKLSDVKFSGSKKNLYLLFSKPYNDGQIRGVARKKDFNEGDYTLATFEKFIGKVIQLDGHYARDSSQNPLLVEIQSLMDITQHN